MKVSQLGRVASCLLLVVCPGRRARCSPPSEDTSAVTFVKLGFGSNGLIGDETGLGDSFTVGMGAMAQRAQVELLFTKESSVAEGGPGVERARHWLESALRLRSSYANVDS